MLSGKQKLINYFVLAIVGLGFLFGCATKNPQSHEVVLIHSGDWEFVKPKPDQKPAVWTGGDNGTTLFGDQK